MPPATAPDETPTRLVEAAARLLADGGPEAVTARKVTAEVGLSTIAVYSHFGSMDGLLAAIWREGFERFRVELEWPGLSEDAVADWMCQAWAYRHFALREPHLYRVMFGPPRVERSPEDLTAAIATFELLIGLLQRCADIGRFDIDDAPLAAHVVWSTVHGHASIELAGSHARSGVEALPTYEACIRHLALGFGDAPDAVAASLARSVDRARRLRLLPRGTRRRKP